MAILQATESSINPLSCDDQMDDIIEPQYVENSIQHLEIVPVDGDIDGQ